MDELFGNRIGPQPGLLAEGPQGVHVERLGSLGRGHRGAGPLAGDVVGKAHHGDVAHLGMGEQQILHLFGRDVLAVADDDVLQPTRDHHEALVVDDAEIAGAEVAVVVEGLGVERGVEVAEHHLGGLRPQLAFLARGGEGAVERDGDQVDAGHRPALGGGELVVGIAVGAHGEDRRLGEAPSRHDARAPEFVLHLLVQRRRFRGAAARESS